MEKGLPFELRQVDLANKSAEFQALYTSISPDPAASAKVPILIDGDTKLIESSIIVEYLDAKYREEGTDLLPTDPADAARARLFAETFSTGPWAGFLALLRAGTPAALEEAKAKTSAGFAALNTCLEKHGREEEGGSYFLGLQYSLADALTVSLLQRILVAIPILRGIDTNALLQEHTRAARWAAAVLARPSAVETQPDPEVMANSLRKYLVPIVE
jgi:glutathione S-transferase